jgi:hypothetical protein
MFLNPATHLYQQTTGSKVTQTNLHPPLLIISLDINYTNQATACFKPPKQNNAN